MLRVVVGSRRSFVGIEVSGMVGRGGSRRIVIGSVGRSGGRCMGTKKAHPAGKAEMG